ncbi:MAG TPA: helix-turn-helix domain-containing protein [Sphingomonas sp.]
MTAFTLGEATATALGRMTARYAARSGTPVGGIDRPVRRGSVEAGSFEGGFFAAPAPGACDAMLRAARQALDAGRRLKRLARTEGRVLSASERAIASLTAGAVRVFEELCALARLNRGRVYPSYDRLAAATALGRATVARALDLLEGAGFLARQRRFIRVEGEGAGPRYAQTSNAYRPQMPSGLAAKLARVLPRWQIPAPLPDDALEHAQAETASVTTMRAGLSCRDLAEAAIEGPLGRVLARLGHALDRRSERESHDEPETLTQLIHKGCEDPNARRWADERARAG